MLSPLVYIYIASYMSHSETVKYYRKLISQTKGKMVIAFLIKTVLTFLSPLLYSCFLTSSPHLSVLLPRSRYFWYNRFLSQKSPVMMDNDKVFTPELSDWPINPVVPSPQRISIVLQFTQLQLSSKHGLGITSQSIFPGPLNLARSLMFFTSFIAGMKWPSFSFYLYSFHWSLNLWKTKILFSI